MSSELLSELRAIKGVAEMADMHHRHCSPPPLPSSTTVLLSSMRYPSSPLMASSEASSSSTYVPSPVSGSSLHPLCRCEYPSSDKEAIEEPGSFDATTYALPWRRLGFGSFLQYRPPVGGPEAKVVRREPELHLSILNVPRNRRLEARGGGKKVHKWFVTSPEQARELVRAVGFEAFVLGLNLPKMDWSLMTSLVER
ncbi:hypothetical protein RHMOL_Rhmol02G0179200 [Rhododendron molle]|uniref:Uncharacterized protein n=1 Tax=Rhododendron molle TaxID=49168 RepID=A0ACC0PRV7_RHOML|nr:hypothetical protein RHMOL_Rhmol02G0179200 [Rhododendron molle]